MKSHCDLILDVLQDEQWHNAIELFNRCMPGKVNWALRSRVSDLKKRGYNIDSRIGTNRQGEYKLTKGESIWTQQSLKKV